MQHDADGAPAIGVKNGHATWVSLQAAATAVRSDRTATWMGAWHVLGRRADDATLAAGAAAGARMLSATKGPALGAAVAVVVRGGVFVRRFMMRRCSL